MARHLGSKQERVREKETDGRELGKSKRKGDQEG